MKLAKLSLAAIVVAGLSTSAFAADTLAGAFKEGTVTGALKAYYFDRDNGATSEGILNTGLMLNYKTGSFYGFGLNFTGQTNHAPFASADAKAMFIGDEYGSGAQLSEAYISYTGGKTTVLVGRMFLDTPLVASSGSRMVKEAFEGAAIINADIPNTTLIAGYVDKFQGRTDGAGGIGEFTQVGGDNDGAYTLAAINKSIAGLTLTAAYANVLDTAEVVYAEASYEGKASNFTYGVAAQYYLTNYDAAVLADDADLWGVKATLGMGAFTGTVAYSTVQQKNVGVTPGLGGGADLAYTGSPLNSDSYAANTDAYKIGVSYAVLKNANIGLSYTVNEIDQTNTENAYTALEADYAFDGALKGFDVSFVYEDQSKDADGNEMRVKLTYKF